VQAVGRTDRQIFFKPKTLFSHQQVLEVTLATSTGVLPIKILNIDPDSTNFIIPLCLPVGWYPT
jgi:hypothetical protein